MQSLKPLFVGLDCGGSKCRARLMDASNRKLGEGEAGPANGLLGMKTVFLEIEKAIAEALENAGMQNVPCHEIHAGLGMAGLCIEQVRVEFDHYKHPFASLRAETDAHIAQLGAYNGEDGAILIAGTGSCGYAVIKGETVTIGGKGFQLSDQGSGAHLGRAAIRRALQGFEKILPLTPVCEALMARFDNSADRLVSWAEQARPADYGAITPMVFEYAGTDLVADELIRKSAQDIELLINALIAAGAVSVALVGGLAEPLKPFLSEKSKSLIGIPSGDSLDGAVLLAQQNFNEIQNTAKARTDGKYA